MYVLMLILLILIHPLRKRNKYIKELHFVKSVTSSILSWKYQINYNIIKKEKPINKNKKIR
jgi:hypothetical protein